MIDAGAGAGDANGGKVNTAVGDTGGGKVDTAVDFGVVFTFDSGEDNNGAAADNDNAVLRSSAASCSALLRSLSRCADGCCADGRGSVCFLLLQSTWTARLITASEPDNLSAILVLH